MKSYDKEVEVLWEDNHLLALNKPVGVLSQPNQFSTPSLETAAKAFIKKKYQKPGNVFLQPIHRLDKPVSGIVLFAKTSKALSRLQAQMRCHHIKKMYTAKVEGHLKEKEGELCHFLVHRSYRAQIKQGPHAKQGMLSYTVQKEEAHTSLLWIHLKTGRYHQIRAQLSYIGHPILGDVKYGSTLPYFRLALHHTQLIFFHPITNDKTRIFCDVPFK